MTSVKIPRVILATTLQIFMLIGSHVCIKRPFPALGMCPCKKVLHENTGNQMNFLDFVLRALNAARVRGTFD